MRRSISSPNFLITVICIHSVLSDFAGENIWNNVPCDEDFQPDHCDYNNELEIRTVDDFDRCGPARLPLNYRNYFFSASGRKSSEIDNKKAIRKIRIVPKFLRDLSKNSLKTTILGTEIDFPIGIAPVSMQGVAHPDGESATLSGVSGMNTIMVLSCFANTLLEDIADKAQGSNVHLWMQTFIFQNRSLVEDIVRRAEKSGFEAIVVTCDTSINAQLTCKGRQNLKLPPDVEVVNVPPASSSAQAIDATFRDIEWLKSKTKLPIVAKGLLSAHDAVRAIKAGASAILVSNHGGRQLDSSPATIDALPEIVDAVKRTFRGKEVYMDGGIRNGNDVFKAIARGAKMVFVGRPTVWGLALAGSDGVNKMMNILKSEFNESMLLSGYTTPSQIKRESLIPQVPTYE